MKDSKLIVETIPAITYCESCGAKYGTVKYGKICPECGSGHTYLLQGNEFNIKRDRRLLAILSRGKYN